MVDIGAPDYETRVAILRRKAEERGAEFQPGVLETVAAAGFTNVRELMGVLNRLIAYPGGERNAAQRRGRQGAARGRGAAPAAAGAPRRRRERGPTPDEFAAFLTDVTVTVGKAVEAWRARIAEAILRWEGEGYRTRRLEQLLEQDTPVAPDEEIGAFARDVERLRALEAEVSQFDPQAAGQSVFRDPERLAEARGGRLAHPGRRGAAAGSLRGAAVLDVRRRRVEPARRQRRA